MRRARKIQSEILSTDWNRRLRRKARRLSRSRKWTTDSGVKREDATSVEVTRMERTAEVAGDYLKKGRPILSEGRLQLDSWDDKQTGQKRSNLKVIGESMQVLGGRPGGAVAPGEST